MIKLYARSGRVGIESPVLYISQFSCFRLFIPKFCQLSFHIAIAITAAGVVSCGGRKKSPRTSSIVQIVIYFWSFQISGDVRLSKKMFK